MPALSSDKRFASSSDLSECRTLLRNGSRSFFAASRMLPPNVRGPATSLYAFCRVADDAIDGGGDRAAALEDLRMRLDRIYAGDPVHLAADRAFADVVSQFAIPKTFPSALLEGFEWDSAQRHYEDLSQLTSYAVRVAGSVGAMMAMLMGVRDTLLIARACDLGVAMQLTNIARDVGEDARAGRLYLPREWLREAGIDSQAWLAKPTFSPELALVIERVLAAADALYLRSDPGIAALPAPCRPGMHAARLLYCEIGREVARRNFDSVNRRAVVSWQRKVRVLADAARAASWTPAETRSLEMLQEADFLLGSLPSEIDPEERPPSAERGGGSRVGDRVAWLVDLFERLEQREQSLTTGSAQAP